MSQSLISRKIHDYNKFKALVDRSITTVTSEMLNGAAIIGESAFYSCTSLTSVEIPNSVTSIGRSVFYSCTSLTSIEIPNSVTSIEYNAFKDCSNLASVTIRATAPPELDSSAFTNTSTNLIIYVPSASVSSYKSASGWSTYASKIQAIPEA